MTPRHRLTPAQARGLGWSHGIWQGETCVQLCGQLVPEDVDELRNIAASRGETYVDLRKEAP